MMVTHDTDQAFAASLPMLMRRSGVRVTHPRLLVLQALHQQPGVGLTASDLYQRMLDISTPLSLSTIYAVLQTFKRCRLVVVHRLADGVQAFSCLGISPARDASAPATVRATAPAAVGPARP